MIMATLTLESVELTIATMTLELAYLMKGPRCRGVVIAKV